MKIKIALSSSNILERIANKYFAPRAVQFAFNQNELSRETVIGLTPEQFLKLANPGFDMQKYKEVVDVLDSGDKFSDIPFLGVETLEDGDVKVSDNGADHEGRHRIRALEARGVTLVPVVVISRAGDYPTYRWGQTTNRPNYLFGHNGYAVKFPKTNPH
jgi:hypothetical protein